MKRLLYLFITLIVILSSVQKLWANGEELNVYYGPSLDSANFYTPLNYTVKVYRVSDIYDAGFNYIPTGDTRDTIYTGTVLKINFTWSTKSAGSFPKDLYYGKYHITFLRADGVSPVADAEIDFRDADYVYPGVYTTFDFDVQYYGGKVHFSHHSSVPTFGIEKPVGSGIYTETIWHLDNKDLPNQAPFKNLIIGITNNSSADPFTVNVNGSTFSNCSYNWSTRVAGGSSTTWIVDVPNRMDLAYQPTRTYEYFVAWSNGAAYNPTSDLSTLWRVKNSFVPNNNLDLLNAVTARYKASNLEMSISGPGSFAA
jgi:hypothetical protein